MIVLVRRLVTGDRYFRARGAEVPRAHLINRLCRAHASGRRLPEGTGVPFGGSLLTWPLRGHRRSGVALASSPKTARSALQDPPKGPPPPPCAPPPAFLRASGCCRFDRVPMPDPIVLPRRIDRHGEPA